MKESEEKISSPTNCLCEVGELPPVGIVVFGATGDLTRRKLVPALMNLRKDALLSERFAFIGLGRSPHTDVSFQDHLREGLTDNYPEAQNFFMNFHYLCGDLKEPATYESLRKLMEDVDNRLGLRGNFVFYLAVSPEFFAPVTEALSRHGLMTEESENGGFRRIVVEKPFGSDKRSAYELNKRLLSCLHESQIYRIDHYLGKETVQNLLIFRFANGIFEPLWNRRYIERVEITVTERIGVEGRAGYYEKAGALRDMVANHLLQVMCLMGMEPPSSFEAAAIHEEKVKFLKSIRQLRPEEVEKFTFRGQYGEGPGMKAYRQEPGVNPNSDTETLVALCFDVDNWRWAGTPFYLGTGKRLAERTSEIVVYFRPVPTTIFKGTNAIPGANRLVVKLQPEEKISLHFTVKEPDLKTKLKEVAMDFDYQSYFQTPPRTGYETLLYDCIQGDSTLFQRSDQVELAWEILEPILAHWSRVPPKDFPNYASGISGHEILKQFLKTSSP